MKFDRLYPVEFLFKGRLGEKDKAANLIKLEREEKFREYVKKDKPALVHFTVDEIEALEEDTFLYKITGYSSDPNVR